MTTDSQRLRILAHLKKGGTITQAQARYWFGCDRLSARIRRLREQGHGIETTIITVSKSKKVARYSLPK